MHSGLKLTGAALTTLAPHGLPSDGGGDWASILCMNSVCTRACAGGWFVGLRACATDLAAGLAASEFVVFRGDSQAIARRAAVHLKGVERVTIQDCLFERIDGNGEFRWTAVADVVCLPAGSSSHRFAETHCM